MLSKKELKEAVRQAFQVVQVKSKRRITYVELSYLHTNGRTYTGYDFSEWSSDDRKVVKILNQIYKEARKCGCFACSMSAQVAAILIEKFDYNEQRGVDMATGRAVLHIVEQIMEEQKKAEAPQGDMEHLSGDGLFGPIIREGRKGQFVHKDKVRVN